MNWHEHFAGSDFSHFCKRAIKMLEACSNMPWVRYEEFSLNPEAVMDVICKTFKLEDQSSYWGEVDANIKLSGDSGRSSETMALEVGAPYLQMKKNLFIHLLIKTKIQAICIYAVYSDMIQIQKLAILFFIRQTHQKLSISNNNESKSIRPREQAT